MTEVDTTTTTDTPRVDPTAADVEMASANALPQTGTVSPVASNATSAEEKGAESAEPLAADPPASSAEDTMEVEVSAPSSAEPTATLEWPSTSEQDSEIAVETDTPSAGPSADVKMEETPVEEPVQAKRKDVDCEDCTTAANPNDESADEPSPKRLKVASKPTEAVAAPPTTTTTETTEATKTTETTSVASVAATAVSAPIMMSRDDMAKLEEDTGLLKFDVISNDGTPEHMIQLTTLKNIFARQLPKMPREYIVRLVFDRNHRSMVILKNSKQVIGGICYRPFEPNHFAEIAFCAINAADQVKGYGTRLMNHLKEYVKASGITHFLTYADNYAIGYFKKQGFAKVVSMPRANWFGYIKDYDGGTLMECTIHHQINYLRITSMVHAQRKKIQDKIKERSHAETVYPGLEKFAEGRTMDLYMIPGVQEAGWSRATIRNNRVGTRDPGSLKTQLQQLWKHVSSHRSAWPFHEPVDTSIVVDYLDYIKEPVDLTLIQKRIESGHYLSKAAFKDDLDKMCANCMLYNTPDTNYFKAAKDLQEFIEKRVQVAK